MFAKLMPNAYNKVYFKNCKSQNVKFTCNSNAGTYNYELKPGETKETKWNCARGGVRVSVEGYFQRPDNGPFK